MLLSIPNDEKRLRQKTFFQRISEKGLDCAILFSPIDIFYLTGFHFYPTERPMAFFMDPDKKTYLFMPFLEQEHAEDYAVIDFVHSYPEYPGIKHPMEYIKIVLEDAGFENAGLVSFRKVGK
jgi:Xaa-Pro dipeptidase